jgi:cytosine deaminase
MAAAIAEARASLAQGGIPIGAALGDADGNVLGRGHNQRVQRESQILHAEIDCLAGVGRRSDFAETILYSTLMPCYMCAGAVIQFGIRKVVVGESRNFSGAADLLRSHNVDLIDLDLPECTDLLADFIANNPDLWSEDIGA